MYETNEELIMLIDNLLVRGKEGNYWDFKREWPEKTSDLIKDIICFSNTVHDYDCYLIYGIDDDLNIVGVENKKYNQSDIIDSISNLHFAGDILPKIELEELVYMGHSLDILIVKNIVNTPIYLNKTHGEMLQGCIYSREGDKNTQNKGNADNQTIEHLWRKRLGLTKPKIDYFYDKLVNKEEWNGKDSYFFNIYNPEYTIEFDNPNYEADEFYFYAMTNEKGYLQNINLKYHDTVLDNHETAVLDSGQLQVPTPEWGFFGNNYNKNNFSYKYYVRESTTFKILSYLYNWENHEERLAFIDLKNVIIIYESLEEKENYETFIHKNIEKVLKKIKDSDEFKFVSTGDETTTELYKKRLNTGYILVKLLEEWRQYKKHYLSN